MEEPDLSGTDSSGTDSSGRDLSDRDLPDRDLSDRDLSDRDLPVGDQLAVDLGDDVHVAGLPLLLALGLGGQELL
ncbi:hypothetical protein, partial [Streptomyces phaeofaciens]